MRPNRHALPIVLALLAVHPALAQAGRNTAVTGFAGVPWGTPLDGVRAALGVPDSASTRGDTASLRYLQRDFAGMRVELWASATPAEGLVMGGYSMPSPQCGTTFDRVRNELLAAHPRLVPVGIPLYLSSASRSTNRDTVCASGTFSESQLFRDPDGPGVVMELSAAPPGKPSYLAVVVVGAYRGRTPLPGDGSRGSATFRDAGVEMTVMPGFSLPREVTSGSGRRFFAAQRGAASIRLSIFDPQPRSERWPSERRLQSLRELVEGLAGQHDDGWHGEVQTRGELAYGDVRFTVATEAGPSAVRGRVYASLTGPFRPLLVVYSEPGSPRPELDQAVAEMLDSVRLTGDGAAAP
jgi:hypothetical protein